MGLSFFESWQPNSGYFGLFRHLAKKDPPGIQLVVPAIIFCARFAILREVASVREEKELAVGPSN